ncbi:MAG TPA: Fic family protein [Methanotrichaceae archaeon]|nr:Fic family protein [Methanotrichaceae archaeon]
MLRSNYRLERHATKDGAEKYFLVKDIKVGQKNAKVRKYLGSAAPSPDDLKRLSQKLTLEIETVAVKKAAHLSSARYAPKYLDQETAELLELVRYTYKAFTEVLTADELKKYEEDFEISYVQGTTAIEGNTLSLGDTRDLLINSILPAEKSLREINEVQNFKRVMDYRNRHRGRLSLRFIKNLHALIMRNIDDESAGVFRRTDMVAISGCDFRLTPAFEIEDELTKIINDYYDNIKAGGHPFEEAVIFHYHFEMIHPFTDGNGRVGRELFNYLLMRSRPAYPRLLFLGKDRAEYIKALKLGNEERYEEMVAVFADLIIKQRRKVLEENFRKMMESERRGQMRLSDFIEI